MKVNDVSSIVNDIYNEMTGSTDVTVISSDNIVDIGKAIKAASSSVDTLYGKIVDKVGKVAIKNKEFRNKFAILFKDSWEFGSIMETLRVKPFTAVSDPSINPSAGKYDSLLDYSPAEVVAKYFTDIDNFEFQHWKPTDQLWGAFESMENMTRFLSALEVSVLNSLDIRLQGLSQTAVTHMIACTALKDFPDTATEDYSANSYARSVNVLKLYNDRYGKTLTAEKCLTDADFLRFFVEILYNYRDRLTDMTKAFNIDGELTQSYAEDLLTVVLSPVANAIKVNLQSDTYHAELVELPGYTPISYWQGSGAAYDFGSVSEINQYVKLEDSDSAERKNVEISGVLACVFDKMAVGITCEKRKTTSFYHAELDQVKFFDKYQARYFNDFSENFVFFYVA